MTKPTDAMKAETLALMRKIEPLVANEPNPEMALAFLAGAYCGKYARKVGAASDLIVGVTMLQHMLASGAGIAMESDYSVNQIIAKLEEVLAAMAKGRPH